MAASPSKAGPATAAEVRAIIGALVVERNELLKAGDAGGAEALELAIDYWRMRLAKAPEAVR